VWELIEAGGWLMVPIVACSLLALAIIGERIWTLQRARVVPPGLVNEVREALLANRLNAEAVQALRLHSPLGRVLATAIAHRYRSRAVMLEGIEDAGRHEAHVLERFLNSLGTIAAITPLLGLLGTVIGMIKVFAAITAAGLGDPATMAGGISEALITTAAGLTVAIPSLIAYRYFRGQVDQLIVDMEQESLRLVDALALNRAGDEQPVAGGPQR